MTGHDDIRLLLYDCAAGRLDAAEHARVEAHCAGCPECAGDLAAIRVLLPALAAGGQDPASERPASFWMRFPENVEKQIANLAGTRSASSPRPARRVVSLPRYILGTAGVAALVGAVFLFSSRTLEPPVHDEPLPADVEAVPPRSDQDAVSDYFRRSKALLVGVTNRTARGEGITDLTAERRASHELIGESRRLRGRPLDARSARVIDDMEKILIKLANVDSDNPAGDVTLVREGIARTNLLFRVRMTQAAFDRPVPVTAGGTDEPGEFR